MSDHDTYPAPSASEASPEVQALNAIVTSAEALIQQLGRPSRLDPDEIIEAKVSTPETEFMGHYKRDKPSARITKPINRLAESATWTYRFDYGPRSLIVAKDPDDPHAIIVGSHESPTRASEVDLRIVAEDLSRALSQNDSDEVTQPSESSQERTRHLSAERSAATVDGLMRLHPELAHEVNVLAGGSIGIIRAIKEKLSDEIGHRDPGEPLTPDSIRTIVGAPTDEALLEDWRTKFYEPYRAKYRAETE